MPITIGRPDKAAKSLRHEAFTQSPGWFIPFRLAQMHARESNYSGHSRNLNFGIYHIITDSFFDKLEQGTIPWQQSWSMYGPAVKLLTRKPDRGINQLILRNLHPRPFYLTYNQILKLGGQVKRGSHSIPITFWQVLFRLKENGRRISADEAGSLPAESTTRSAVLRYYRVFNIDDTEGVEVVLLSDQVLIGTEIKTESKQKRAFLQVQNVKLLARFATN